MVRRAFVNLVEAETTYLRYQHKGMNLRIEYGRVRPKQRRRTKLQLITVHLPETIIKALDELVRRGLFPTRSEAIRAATRELLKKYSALLMPEDPPAGNSISKLFAKYAERLRVAARRGLIPA